VYGWSLVKSITACVFCTFFDFDTVPSSWNVVNTVYLPTRQASEHSKIQENTGHIKNTGKYRTATKIQENTGFTGPLGSL